MGVTPGTKPVKFKMSVVDGPVGVAGVVGAVGAVGAVGVEGRGVVSDGTKCRLVPIPPVMAFMKLLNASSAADTTPMSRNCCAVVGSEVKVL